MDNQLVNVFEEMWADIIKTAPEFDTPMNKQIAQTLYSVGCMKTAMLFITQGKDEAVKIVEEQAEFINMGGK